MIFMVLRVVYLGQNRSNNSIMLMALWTSIHISCIKLVLHGLQLNDLYLLFMIRLKMMLIFQCFIHTFYN